MLTKLGCAEGHAASRLHASDTGLGLLMNRTTGVAGSERIETPTGLLARFISARHWLSSVTMSLPLSPRSAEVCLAGYLQDFATLKAPDSAKAELAFLANTTRNALGVLRARRVDRK